MACKCKNWRQKIVSICEGSLNHYGGPHNIFWEFFFGIYALNPWTNTHEKLESSLKRDCKYGNGC